MTGKSEIEMRLTTGQVAELVEVGSLTPHPDNPRRGDVAALAALIEANGFVGSIVAQTSTRRVLIGNHRLQAVQSLGFGEIPVTWADVDDDEARQILLADNRASDTSGYDEAELYRVLDEHLQAVDSLEGTGWTDEDAQDLSDYIDGLDYDPPEFDDVPDVEHKEVVGAPAGAPEQAEDQAEDEDTPDVLPSFSDVPDVVWPSANRMGIPELLLSHQADVVDFPLARWGEHGRKKRAGTVLFYADDYKFHRLWRDPTQILHTQCATAGEVNFSTHPQAPPAVTLWRIYQKRWLARFWQSHGVRIMVDLNVDPQWSELNMLGVPKGWRAYCTRGYNYAIPDIARELERAREHAGTQDVLFLVYGGGAAVKAWCEEVGAWWHPEVMDLAKKRYTLDDCVGGLGLKTSEE